MMAVAPTYKGARRPGGSGEPLVHGAERPVARHCQPRARTALEYAGHRREHRVESIARIESPEKEELGEAAWPGGARVGAEELGVHAVRDDLPVGVEVAGVGIDDRLAHRHARRVAV